MRDGEISRAMRLLHSFGIAGITEDILRQMARKHPPRQHSVPQQLPGPAAPAVAPMELTETFRGLRLQGRFLRMQGPLAVDLSLKRQP